MQRALIGSKSGGDFTGSVLSRRQDHPRDETLAGLGERDRLQTSQLPLYVVVANLMRSDIEKERWVAGTQVPTIAALADQYGLARVTIRQALGVLSAEGLIKAIQGKGTFVTEQQKRLDLIHLESNWEHLLQALDGNVPEALEVRSGADLPPPHRQAKTDHPYRYMRRLHKRYGKPYCTIDLFLSETYYGMDPGSFDSQMVIPVLSRLAGPNLKRLEQSFRIGSADLSTAKLLEIPPGAAIGDVTRIITDRDNTILYLGTGHYRGDLVVFNTAIEAPRRSKRKLAP